MEPAAELQAVQRMILGSDRPADTFTRIVPAQLPPDVPGFAGRGPQLRRLNALLPTDRAQALTTVVISAIDGIAGVGKTALAVRWAHRVADWFPDGQLYLDLRGFDDTASPTAPTAAMRSLLITLGVEHQRVPLDPQALIGMYRSLLANRRMLIVLDNALSAEQVRPLLPGSPDCLVVITSRNHLSGLAAREGATIISIDALSEAESRQMLAERLGPQRIEAEREAVEAIIARCAGLPLALAIVAARAGPPGSLSELAQQASTLDVLASPNDRLSDLRTVFSWSYQMLGPDSARLFRLMGAHPGPDISARAMTSLLGQAARTATDELINAHLLIRRGAGRFAMHGLLKAYARELVSDEERRLALRRLIDHYLGTGHAAARALRPTRDVLPLGPAEPGTTPEPIEDQASALAWFIAEHRVILDVFWIAASEAEHARVGRLAWTLTTYLDRSAAWQELVEVQLAALESARRATDPKMQCLALRALANARMHLRSLDEALAAASEALEIHEALDDQAGEAHIRVDISRILERMGRLPEALVQVERARDLYWTVGHDSGLANTLNGAGWYKALLGDYEAAIDNCKQALDVLVEIQDVAGQAGTWDSLGYIQRQTGNLTEAILCYESARDLCVQLGDRFYEADALNNLGDVYDSTGRRDDASVAWTAALRILKELGHADAAAVARKLDNAD